MEVINGSTIKEVETAFPSINSFVIYSDTYYICPSGVDKPLLNQYNFDTNVLTPIETLPYGMNDYDKWGLECFYRSEAQGNTISHSIMVAFINTSWFYYYDHEMKRWPNQIRDFQSFIVRIDIDENMQDHDYENNRSYLLYCLFYHNSFSITLGKIIIDDNSEPKESNIHTSTISEENLGEIKASLVIESSTIKRYYIITYGEAGYKLFSVSLTFSILEEPTLITKDDIDYILPLNFSPDTYIITNFEFINHSTNFYYQLKTITNEVYWGIGNIVSDKVIITYNSKETINTIHSYRNLQMGVMISMSPSSYFLCPYSLGTTSEPYECNPCPSDTVLFLNPSLKNDCVTSTINMEEVSTGVYQCVPGYIGSTTASECITCKEYGIYNTLPDNYCDSNCDTSIAVKNDIDKTCTYCYKYETTKYLYDNNCIIEKPIGTYISDVEHYVLSPCDQSCYTCEETATKCLSCTGNLYLTPIGFKCTETYEGFYGIEKTLHKWINCAS